MSTEELKALLRRIEKIRAPVEEPSQPSEALQTLLNRMETRKWKEWLELELEGFMEGCSSQLREIEHFQTCEECTLLLQLDIERYLGGHSPWYLDLGNDIEMVADESVEWVLDHPANRGMPRVSNYEFGNYWDRTEGQKDTMKFIKDRMRWAEQNIRIQYNAAFKLQEILRNWKFDWQPTGVTIPLFFGVKIEE